MKFETRTKTAMGKSGIYNVAFDNSSEKAVSKQGLLVQDMSPHFGLGETPIIYLGDSSSLNKEENPNLLNSFQVICGFVEMQMTKSLKLHSRSHEPIYSN